MQPIIASSCARPISVSLCTVLLPAWSLAHGRRLDYGPCLAEQVEPGRTALTFQTSQELAQRIDELLHGFPNELQFPEQMQRNIERAVPETWAESWKRDAAPAFRP
jgi:hypothetical protein